MDAAQVWAIVKDGGALGLAIVWLVALWQGWMVPGRIYDRALTERDTILARIIKERDEAMEYAKQNATIAERVLALRARKGP